MDETTLPLFGPGFDPGPSFVDVLRRTAPHALPGAGLSGSATPPFEITHGTTVVAIRFDGGVVMAGDRRATAGYTIATNILNVGGFVDPLKKEGQVELSRNLQIATAAVDSTGMCIFVAFPALDIPECLPALIDMLNARFGIALTGDDVTNLGKHILKVERQFNIDAGFTNKDDRLPEFFSKETVAPHNAIWDFTDAEIDEFWNF